MTSHPKNAQIAALYTSILTASLFHTATLAGIVPTRIAKRKKMAGSIAEFAAGKSAW
jgi:hypothetical protein